MNLLNFVKQYPDETSCKEKFKEYRESAPNVEERITIGSKIKKAMSVKTIKHARVYAAIP
jgi:hypothetical protein